MEKLEEKGRKGMSIDRFSVDLASKNYTRLFKALEEWALRNPTGVIETTGASPKTVDMLRRIQNAGIDSFTFNLRCSLEEFLAREEKRKDRPPLTQTAWLRPIYGKGAVIDTTGKSVDEVLEEMYKLCPSL